MNLKKKQNKNKNHSLCSIWSAFVPRFRAYLVCPIFFDSKNHRRSLLCTQRVVVADWSRLDGPISEEKYTPYCSQNVFEINGCNFARIFIFDKDCKKLLKSVGKMNSSYIMRFSSNAISTLVM